MPCPRNIANLLQPIEQQVPTVVAATTALPSIDLQTNSVTHSVAYLIRFAAVAAASAANYLSIEAQESDDNATWSEVLPDKWRFITPRNRTATLSYAEEAGINPFRVDDVALANTSHLIEVQVGVKRYLRLRLVATGAPSANIQVTAFVATERVLPAV